MSTRSNVDFYEQEPKIDDEPEARLYHHSDGYPSWRLKNIKKAVKMALEGYGGGGYSYRIKEFADYMTDLAAFYVLANKTGAGDVEIDRYIHGDIEYRYQIWADRGGTVMVRILDPDALYDEGTLDELVAKYVKEA